MSQLKQVPWPRRDDDLSPVMLTDETMAERKQRVIDRMKASGFDHLIIYADLEHGSNFEYLVGFLPRFEEALLILNDQGDAFLVLGNENLNKAGKARLANVPIHMPYFSLPNQPMTARTVTEILTDSDLSSAHHVGLVGWKNFTSPVMDNTQLIDLPAYLMTAFQEVAPKATFANATALFIGRDGVRTTMNANEFAHYEFGAALAGNCILDVMNELRLGMSEMALASKLSAYGQSHSVVTILAAGERFVKANIYPTAKQITIGDTLSITTGYKGGLESRGGFAIATSNDLPTDQKDYLERVAYPYFDAICYWLDHLQIGQSGGAFYDDFKAQFPPSAYGWTLNPGHLAADEEWLGSPIYPSSDEPLKSGMLFQIDVIPSVAGYNGISAESGVFLADSELRKQIQETYPAVWRRIAKRRQYLAEHLNIALSEAILPTSAATVFCNPFLLDKSSALVQS